MSQHIAFDDWLMKRLTRDAEEAAALLRVALEEADEDPRGLSMTLHYITTARGGINDLGLTLEETTALLNALGRHLDPNALPQAA
jgi:DNA-binding phage protein